MKNSGDFVLKCGCIILDLQIASFCEYHNHNQPQTNDPLDNFLKAKDLDDYLNDEHYKDKKDYDRYWDEDLDEER